MAELLLRLTLKSCKIVHRLSVVEGMLQPTLDGKREGKAVHVETD